MSTVLDITDVGPQNDGTYSIPYAGMGTVNQNADTAGSKSFDYGQAVLDVFKLGVGVWNQQTQQQNLLDYKRYESTQSGLVQQGAAAQSAALAAASARGKNTLLILAVVGVVALILIERK